MTTTRLGGVIANAGADAGASRLRRTVLSGRRGEELELPVIGRVFVELCGHATVNQIEAEVWQEMRALTIELNGVTAPTYEAERAARTLARAVRESEPDRRDVAVGTVEDWKALDPDVIGVAWQAYGDVRERLDPLGGKLTQADRDAITVAVKKKEPTLLRSFGVVKLAAYMISTADPPAT